MRTEDFLSADYEDILFENRNKRYGAYLLRKLYSRHLNEAFLISLILFILLFGMPLMYTRTHPVAIIPPITVQPKEIFTIYLPPPPAVAKSITKISTVQKTDNTKLAPVIKPDADAKPSLPTADNPAPIVPVIAITGAPLAPDAPSTPSINLTVPASRGALTWSGVMPKFSADKNALTKYLQDHLKYPSQARDNNIEGQVIVQFIVDENGNISDIKVLRDIGGGCGDEAVRVIKGMPAWQPGEQNGQPVPVYFTLPITFRLNHGQN